MLVILLNGAPGSGKDTVSRMIVTDDPLGDEFDTVLDWKFAAPLKAGAHLLLGQRQHHAAFEEQKDQPLDEFFGLTPRQFYIALSEQFMKKMFGPTVFGMIAARRMKAHAGANTLITFSDCGFVDEVREMFPILQPGDKVALIRVFRPNTSFTGDSRSHIEPVDITRHAQHPQLFFKTLENDGSLGDLADKVATLLEEIYAWYKA